MYLPTALDNRKRPRIRRDTCRPPPVLRYALHLATFRLRQDVHRVHVHLARRIWSPSFPERPCPWPSTNQFQHRVIRTRLDRPAHHFRRLQNRDHPTQPEHAPHQTARSIAVVAWSEQWARAVFHVRWARTRAHRSKYAVYGGEWDGVGETVGGRVDMGSGDGCGRCCCGEGEHGDRVSARGWLISVISSSSIRSDS